MPQHDAVPPRRRRCRAMSALGSFVVSLDFELHWGVRDFRTLAEYRDNLLGARRAVPAMLDAFTRHEVRATWATVGFLFARDRDELLAAMPARRPRYSDPTLSPYDELGQVGDGEAADPFHFAPSLIERILATPGQEIGTHTFSHFYALEQGQDRESFRADLEAAIAIARETGVTLRSLVFPRNQCNADYLPLCRELGIVAYRDTEPGWPYTPVAGTDRSPLRRAGRLADAYARITPRAATRPQAPAAGLPVNVPASRFLRPYLPRLERLEPLRLRRILGELTHAARNGLTYHLWWHPHNFGVHLDENMAFLERVLTHVDGLRERHGMTSRSMGEVARAVLGEAPAEVG